MSLLVFSSSNSIAQGVIRRLYRSGAYERIVCADIYPNYSAIQRFLNFKHDLQKVNSDTKITDIKISERSDLVHAIQSANKVLYITHDYYSLVPSKLNLIRTVAELSNKHKKKLVALTPFELDHPAERDPVGVARNSEKEAVKVNPNLVHLKSDLTFGPDSSFSNSIITRLVNGYSVSFPSNSGTFTTRPIHSDNLAEIVEASLKNDSHQGKSYFLQGKDTVTLNEYLRTLENVAGRKSGSKSAQPYLNLLSYDILGHYGELQSRAKEFEGIDSFGVSLNSFNSSYTPQSVQESKIVEEDHSFLENRILNFLY